MVQKKHAENHSITIVNEYARTKYLGECLTQLYNRSLVVRTNIVGFRGTINNPTFVEWCIQMLYEKRSETLFDDYYTSSIDVKSFSNILIDIIEREVTGILNIASKDVSCKREFIEKLGKRMCLDATSTKSGSVHNTNGIRRAESLGLDTSKVEKILGYQMPSTDEVIENLVNDYQKRRENDQYSIC